MARYKAEVVRTDLDSTTVIDGIEFTMFHHGGLIWLSATLPTGRQILLSRTNNDFFNDWTYSVIEAASGRPVASSVGQTYFTTEQAALVAALAAI